MARNHAPSVLLFDEVDALAADRKDMRQSAGRTLINQFLSEMDGYRCQQRRRLGDRRHQCPVAYRCGLSPAGTLRSGDLCAAPDEIAREGIIEVMARNKPIRDLDAGVLAKRTKHFSGADLKAVFDRAAEEALAEAMKQGRVVPMTTKSLLRAAKGITPSTKPWFESAKNYALYANQSGFYDDVLQFLGIKK